MWGMRSLAVRTAVPKHHFAIELLLSQTHLRLPFSMNFPDEIIERGVREHPELSVGSNTDGIDVRSVGNSQVLQVRWPPTWLPSLFDVISDAWPVLV